MSPHPLAPSPARREKGSASCRTVLRWNGRWFDVGLGFVHVELVIVVGGGGEGGGFGVGGEGVEKDSAGGDGRFRGAIGFAGFLEWPDLGRDDVDGVVFLLQPAFDGHEG